MISRLFIYLKEMFPLSNFIGTMLTAVTIQLVALKLSGIAPLWDIKLILPGIALTCFSLLIRVMDEFKDYEDDLRNFPHRPLPSGRVYKSDLTVLGWGTVVVSMFFSGLSLTTSFAGFVVLFYSFLMLRWFFIEKTIRKSLPLALLSHHPVVFLHAVYLIVSLESWNPSFVWQKSLLVIPILFIFTNWEFSRKLRSPEEETAYTTYSKIWGPRVATCCALLTQILAQVTVLFIFNKNQTPVFFVGVYLFIYLILVFPYLKFLVKMKSPSSFKKIAESQILFVIGSLLISVFM